jgi:hypothetical protein
VGTLAEFAQRQIRALQHTPGAPMPRPAQCQLVTKVAAYGVAAHAGVALKDFLAVVDDVPAARASSRLYLTKAERRSYTFYSRLRHERIELVSSGIEIGVLLEPTTSAISATYQPRNNDPTAQEILWAGRDFSVLERLTAATLSNGRERGSPALLFHGAALCEAGRVKAGMSEIREYMGRYARDWTMNFAGIGFYYLALEAKRQPTGEDSAALFQKAWESDGSERMAALIEKATGVRPRKPPSAWLQRRFPVEYAYTSFDVPNPRQVALRAALDAMSNDQLLAVCLLATYRSNGPYADFLMRWRNYAAYFRDYFAGLHVLTTVRDRYPGREYHYAREAEVRALGVPFHLLHEHDAAVIGAILPRGSPSIFLLDRTGTVVYQGELDSVEVWDVLASVSA